ncbi:MAG: hypothetical protein ACOCQV_03660 [Halolamina sp.]
MSKHDPPTQPTQESSQPREYRTRPIELDRATQTQPELRWIALEDPEQSFLLEEDDYILDSHFNPQFDIWEVLIRLEPGTESE